jgi:L-alanine-DL-glutamate epimerase-like enolase superfamily enzyme
MRWVTPSATDRKTFTRNRSMASAEGIISRVRRVQRPTDARVSRVDLYFSPVATRIPLKFGSETLTTVTCARVRIQLMDRHGRTAEGWGETPLSVQWAWPGSASYAERHAAMMEFCKLLAQAWAQYENWGHPIEVGNAFQRDLVGPLTEEFNESRGSASPMPHLAALVCCSAFDIALHDAYGQLHDVPVYKTYNGQYMSCDLGDFITPASDAAITFRGQYPAQYLAAEPVRSLPVWHLVGGLDPIDGSDVSDGQPEDGYPVALSDWVERDGLFCLKIKLRGNNASWDYDRIVRVGRTAVSSKVKWLSVDFNCTVRAPAYVNEILDRLQRDEPQIFDMILYVEQPFAYELEEQAIDVRSVAERKPLFMDESAHNWRFIKLGKSLGWTGVALKTCKTQTEAILSLCWARAHGMDIMVQDLTNPMLAQIPHVLLAAHAHTIMGVESNAMQFYPDASSCEARVHPGLYSRRNGKLDLSTISGPGFGYRIDEIARPLPPAAATFG